MREKPNHPTKFRPKICVLRSQLFRLFIRFTTRPSPVLRVPPHLVGIFRRQDSYFIPAVLQPLRQRRKMEENEFRHGTGKDAGRMGGEPLNILSPDKKSCEGDATFICQYRRFTTEEYIMPEMKKLKWSPPTHGIESSD